MVKILPLAHSTMFYNEQDSSKKVSFVNYNLSLMADNPEMIEIISEMIQEKTDSEIDTEVLVKYMESLHDC